MNACTGSNDMGTDVPTAGVGHDISSVITVKFARDNKSLEVSSTVRTSVGTTMCCMETLRKDQELRALFMQIRHSNSIRGKKAGKESADFSESADYTTTVSEALFGYEGVLPRKCGTKHRLDGELVRNDSKNEEESLPPKMRVSCLSGRFSPMVNGKVPNQKRYFCCGAGEKSIPTKCHCLFSMFRDHRFVDLLLVLDQVRLLRRAAKKGSLHHSKELFSSVFGVTSISTAPTGSLGTRGLFYYFHDMKWLGTLCSNAMFVLLSNEAWQKLSSSVVFDAMRVRIDPVTVKAEFNRKEVAAKWVLGKRTHHAYSVVDHLVGYAELLKEGHIKIPNRKSMAESLIQSGLHQQPTPPCHHTLRKVASAKQLFDFLNRYDDSIFRRRPEQKCKYMVVANPMKDGGTVFDLSGAVEHWCDVFAVDVGTDCRVAVDALSMNYLLRYGPDGSAKDGLTQVPMCPGLMEWTSGSFVTGCIGDTLPKEHLQSLVTSMTEFMLVSLRCIDKRGIRRMDLHARMSFKVNRLMSDGCHVQMPHFVVDPSVVDENKKEVFFFRAILPLDRAGLMIRVWADGVDSDSISAGDKLVYVQPGTMLLLPASVATSDCVRFSPQGQRRAEFVFALTKKGKPLPDMGDDTLGYFYAPVRSRGVSNVRSTRSHSATRSCLSDDDRYCNSMVHEFVSMFDF